MDVLISECGWFLTFWSTMILLGAVEFLAPQFPDSADRMRRWPTNLGLGILNGLIASSLPVLTVASAQWAAASGFGVLNWVAAPWWLAVPCTLLVRSLAQYAFHLVSHKNSLLWRLHRIHHCDVHLDASSSLRNHPLELIASAVFLIPFILIGGLSPIVLAVYEAVEVIVNMLTHANIRVPDATERGARPLFVTPGLHRIHHSAFQPEADSNYGNLFSVWDRLFGTYRGEVQTDRLFRFGLDDVSRERAGNFEWQLRSPWLSETSISDARDLEGRAVP